MRAREIWESVENHPHDMATVGERFYLKRKMKRKRLTLTPKGNQPPVDAFFNKKSKAAPEEEAIANDVGIEAQQLARRRRRKPPPCHGF